MSVKKNFFSDNVSGAAPDIPRVLVAANDGDTAPYGADPTTEGLLAPFSGVTSVRVWHLLSRGWGLRTGRASHDEEVSRPLPRDSQAHIPHSTYFIEQDCDILSARLGGGEDSLVHCAADG